MNSTNNGRYILDGTTPVPCDDLMKWATWFEKAERKVARTVVGDTEVSTVFLGLDYSFGDPQGPLLFETLAFGGEGDGECERYSTWEAAVAGHARMVESLEKGLLW